MGTLTLEVTKSMLGHYEVPLAFRKLRTIDHVIKEALKVAKGGEVEVTLRFRPKKPEGK